MKIKSRDSSGTTFAGSSLVLVLNAGSSSLKFAVFERRAVLTRILSGTVERIGSPHSTLVFPGLNGGKKESIKMIAPNHARAFEKILPLLQEKTGGGKWAAIGHRVVHSGPKYSAPRRVDAALLTELRRIRAFDPEHLPAEISLMEIARTRLPGVPQIACFDTAFHSQLPRVAQMLPIPRRFEAQGVKRYGFHGLSYAYLLQELERLTDPATAKQKLVFAHLGNGASMAAVFKRRSVDTTMAFTPAAGLMMGTRSGDLDPGIVSFLAHRERMTPSRFDRMVNHESGLLGVSGTSADMRDLLAREKKDPRAAEAVALFCQQAKKWVGAYAAVLGGLDTLVFAGGIGEHAPPVRARICAGLEFLGIRLDPAQNKKNAPVISAASSRVTVRVIHTDEEIMIAQAVGDLLRHLTLVTHEI